jgi:hypothetical protein
MNKLRTNANRPVEPPKATAAQKYLLAGAVALVVGWIIFLAILAAAR